MRIKVIKLSEKNESLRKEFNSGLTLLKRFTQFQSLLPMAKVIGIGFGPAVGFACAM